MTEPYIPKTVEAELMGDKIVITFSNGIAAIYPSALLYSIIDRATKVETQPEADDSAKEAVEP